jgi:hypothetical protein
MAAYYVKTGADASTARSNSDGRPWTRQRGLTLIVYQRTFRCHAELF